MNLLAKRFFFLNKGASDPRSRLRSASVGFDPGWAVWRGDFKYNGKRAGEKVR